VPGQQLERPLRIGHAHQRSRQAPSDHDARLLSDGAAASKAVHREHRDPHGDELVDPHGLVRQGTGVAMHEDDGRHAHVIRERQTEFAGHRARRALELALERLSGVRI